jgi:hypothetical protein
MKQLWLGRRFQLNERGHYEAWGKSQGERVSVEIDPSFIDREQGHPETALLKMHASIQRAAREKWAAGDAAPIPHTFSGRLDHHRVTLSSEDFKTST